MPTPISYPDTTGFRADSSSAIVKLDRQEFAGWIEVKGSRKRTRGDVPGANADPLGKTRGKNKYELTLSVYVAEFKAFILDHFGPGYGDIQFNVEVTITENGYDTQTYLSLGCTIDGAEFSASASSSDPLKIENIEFSPTKIIFNGVDDNARPLTGQVAIG